MAEEKPGEDSDPRPSPCLSSRTEDTTLGRLVFISVRPSFLGGQNAEEGCSFRTLTQPCGGCLSLQWQTHMPCPGLPDPCRCTMAVVSPWLQVCAQQSWSITCLCPSVEALLFLCPLFWHGLAHGISSSIGDWGQRQTQRDGEDTRSSGSVLKAGLLHTDGAV